MNTSIRHISRFIEQWAPASTQMDFDNVGLLVGDPNQEVKRIITCLDVTEDVVDEAIEEKADLIVAHHPLIFKKLSRIQPTDEHGRMLYKLIRNDIGVLAAHTNLDAARNGVSFVLAETIGLSDIQFLDPSYPLSRKVVWTGRPEAAQKVRAVMEKLSDTGPTGYELNDSERPLYRLEAQLDSYQLGALKRQLKENGVDENEDGLEVFNPDSNSRKVGMGAIGVLPEQLDKKTFLNRLADKLGLDAVRFSGSSEGVQKVAVCGGAGVFLAHKAIKAGADAFVTGDIKYHDYFIDQNNFLLVDVGHYESEVPVVDQLRQKLGNAFAGVTVKATRCNTNAMQTHVPGQSSQ